MEGDINNLKVLEQRCKCCKWAEFRFLSHFSKLPSSSFSPLLPSPFEFLHPKWANMEKKGGELVKSKVEKAEFVQMLQGYKVPQEEIDLLLKYLQNNSNVK
jgi:hypothetical protein